jgi:hypothetical protein
LIGIEAGMKREQAYVTLERQARTIAAQREETPLFP